MSALIDRSGHRYGYLTVLARDTSVGVASHGKRTRWICRCDCGALAVRSGHELAAGESKSCGCLRKAMTGAKRRSHAMTKTPTYRSWQAAKDRCHNPNNDHFKYYGERGVTMCDEWRASFEAFLADMGMRPRMRTLDRIDPAGNYEPSNCRWATMAEQARNKRKRPTH